MGATDKRVDAYIAKSAEFARPILEHFRAVVHESVPGASETIKWGMPFFVLDDRILCNMAAFKAHCAIGFWKAGRAIGVDARDDAMGQLGRIASLKDLPPKRTLASYVKKTAALREGEASGAVPQSAPKPRATKAALAVPDDFAAALRKSRKADAHFDAFPPGQRREYVEWITEAKRAETREKRIAQAVEWIAEGKPRNWKYIR